MRGVISAGHELTAKAGIEILEKGGNAFDAAMASVFASFVCESALTGIGGGGFFMAHSNEDKTLLYDFFPNVPGKGRAVKKDNLLFFPVYMDFTDAKQEFHIGKGAAAVPGCMAGLAEVHRSHCTLPLSVLLAPAISYARNGIVLNSQQAYFNSILSSILTTSEEGRKVYAPEGTLLKEGERIYFRDMADTMECLAHEGLHKFYEGEFASAILEEYGDEGLITEEDLKSYKTETRVPLEVVYRGRKIFTNPPPSSGGCLISFSLKLLEGYDFSSMGHNSCSYLNLLFEVMRLTSEARGKDFDHRIYEDGVVEDFLSEGIIRCYREKAGEELAFLSCEEGTGTGNTTHISVVDEEGNAAAVTTSNGEGCGYVIPGTGVMLNNMLGEEDINPRGFHTQEPGLRMSSMMAPTIVMKGGRPEIVLGSGGSNRIRNAILQVILNITDHKLPVHDAVNSPRCHWDGEVFHAEKGMNEVELDLLERHGVSLKRWGQKNMYFGGVHTVVAAEGGKVLSGAGDMRRGGVCLRCDE